MLTARHVADLSGRQGKILCVRRAGDKMHFLTFSHELGYACTSATDGKDDKDPLDVAVVNLPMDFVKELQANHDFLTLSNFFIVVFSV